MWNRTSKLHDDDLFKRSLIDNVCMALGIGIYECKHECWAQSFFRCLLALGVLDPSNPMQEQVMTTNSRGNVDIQPLDYNNIMEAMKQLDQATWDAAGVKGGGDPRSIADDDNEGVKMSTYAAWFAPKSDRPDTWMNFTAHLNKQREIQTVARFRMGAHNLDIESRRWGPDRTARSCRICKYCNMGKVEDEKHVIAECPAYECERESFMADDHGYDMNNMMNGDGSKGHWTAVARFLMAIHRVRARLSK